MPAYYAMGYLSRGLDKITAIREHPEEFPRALTL
jgi:hypothetical protein